VEGKKNSNEEVYSIENSDDNLDEEKNKIKILKFPEIGTDDIYENLYELRHQISHLKKQLKIKNMLFEELLSTKSL